MTHSFGFSIRNAPRKRLVFWRGVADANAWSDAEAFNGFALVDFERTGRIERDVARRARHAQRLSDFARTREKFGCHTVFFSSLKYELFPFKDGGAPNQHSGTHAFSIYRDIHHIMHAVTQVNVGVSWWPPKRGIAFSFSSETVACGIFVVIRFNFGDAERNVIVPNDRADQVISNIECVSVVEGLGEEHGRVGGCGVVAYEAYHNQGSGGRAWGVKKDAES